MLVGLGVGVWLIRERVTDSRAGGLRSSSSNPNSRRSSGIGSRLTALAWWALVRLVALVVRVAEKLTALDRIENDSSSRRYWALLGYHGDVLISSIAIAVAIVTAAVIVLLLLVFVVVFALGSGFLSIRLTGTAPIASLEAGWLVGFLGWLGARAVVLLGLVLVGSLGRAVG